MIDGKWGVTCLLNGIIDDIYDIGGLEHDFSCVSIYCECHLDSYFSQDGYAYHQADLQLLELLKMILICENAGFHYDWAIYSTLERFLFLPSWGS